MKQFRWISEILDQSAFVCKVQPHSAKGIGCIWDPKADKHLSHKTYPKPDPKMQLFLEQRSVALSGGCNALFPPVTEQFQSDILLMFIMI